jgi:hypothetical protein
MDPAPRQIRGLGMKRDVGKKTIGIVAMNKDVLSLERDNMALSNFIRFSLH